MAAMLRDAKAASNSAAATVAAFAATRRWIGRVGSRRGLALGSTRAVSARTRSASSVAPFASHSSMARRSSASASPPRPAARSAAASARRASA